MRRFSSAFQRLGDLRVHTDIVGVCRVAENLEYTAVWNSAMLQTQVRARSASCSTRTVQRVDAPG